VRGIQVLVYNVRCIELGFAPILHAAVVLPKHIH